MVTDFEIEKDTPFGEWLHERILETEYMEQEPWAVDRIRRVEDRLQSGRPPAERLFVEIPWMDEVTAFTAPGRYIYFCRRLYERCATDEQVAFVVAHEIAHHDLRHLDLFAGWAPRLIALPGAKVLAFVHHLLRGHLYGPERECDADRHALDLCLAAGYDGRECIGIFDILEQHALNHGAFNVVYGLDEETDDAPAKGMHWMMARARVWAWQRRSGYPSIRERRDRLLKYLQSKTGS